MRDLYASRIVGCVSIHILLLKCRKSMGGSGFKEFS